MHTIEPMSPTTTSQAELVSQRLAEIGLTVSGFASALGVRPSFVYSVMKGERRLTKPATVERAANILGISADRLYVAGGHLPPDCWEIIQRRPEMVQMLRLMNDRLNTREVQHDRAQ